MDDSRKQLLTLSMGKLFMKLAIPAMVGMLAVGLYNLVDAIFVGQFVSSEAVGATVIAYNFVLVNMGVAMLFAMGAMSVLSRALGEKDQATIDKLFGTVLIGVSILSIIITIVINIFSEPLLMFVGAQGEILELATKYLRIISFGFVFSALGPALNFLIRGEGQMKAAMRIIIIGMLINIILDPVLIKLFGMGIEGAALATIFAQICVLIGDIIHFRSGKSIIKISKKSFKVSFDVMPKILSVGVSGLVMQIMPAIQMAIMFKVLASYSNDSVILMGASYRVMSFAFISLWGVAQGVQPIIGANYGAKQYQRVKKCFLYFSSISTVIAGVLWLCFMLFPNFILSWFITESAMVEAGIGQFMYFLSIFFMYGLMAMAIVFFQSIGKGGKAAILVAGRQIFFFIPIVLLLPRFMGELGAWLAMPIGDFLTIAMSIIFLIIEFVILNKKIEPLSPVIDEEMIATEA